MVASKEGERRYRDCTFELFDLVIRLTVRIRDRMGKGNMEWLELCNKSM